MTSDNETMKVATDAGLALAKADKRNAELEAEIARLKAEIKSLCKRLGDTEHNLASYKGQAKNAASNCDYWKGVSETLTADNERLSARVERLESAGNALIDYANKPETPSMPSQIYILLDDLLAAIEGRTARREMEEGK